MFQHSILVFYTVAEELIGRGKRAPHWCSIEISRDIYIFMCLSWSKMRTQNYVAKHAHALGQFGAVKTDQWHPYYSFRLYARTALVWTKKKRSLRNEKLKANGASVC